MPFAVNLHYDELKEKTNVDLRLYHYGYEDCEPLHSWGPGIKDHFKIHLVFSGKGTYKMGNNQYELGPGQGFLTTPDTVVSYTADSDDPWSYGWFAFNGLNAQNYLLRAGLSKENPILTLKEPEYAISLLKEMITYDSTLSSKDLKLMSGLYQLLSLVIESKTSKTAITDTQSSAKFTYLRAAQTYIETNYSRRMTVEEMAKHIGISRKYLARLFAQAYKMPPQTYLLTYRMERAKILLLETELNIGEVAYSVGYQDQFVFSKAFKNYTGHAPSHSKNGASRYKSSI